MTYKRVPNYQLDDLIRNLETFSNYNASIEAYRANNGDQLGARYSVTHWNTRILDLDLATMTITHLAYGYISQTTSTLVGRILRNLPRATVEQYLDQFGNTPDRKRLARMARI